MTDELARLEELNEIAELTDELEMLEELDEIEELTDVLERLEELDAISELTDVATSEDVDEFAELDEVGSAGAVVIVDELDVDTTTGEAEVALDPPPEPPHALSSAEAPIIIKAFIVFITRFSILMFM